MVTLLAHVIAGCRTKLLVRRTLGIFLAPIDMASCVHILAQTSARALRSSVCSIFTSVATQGSSRTGFCIVQFSVSNHEDYCRALVLHG